MKNKLQNYCRELGIEEVKVIAAEPYLALRDILEDRRKKGYYTSFEESDLEKRWNPLLTMENAKTIIVCMFPYYTGDVENSNLSKYIYPLDYHIVAKNKLNKIGEYLKGEIESFEYLAFVDSGPLVDRYLAHLGGLGFYGINSHLINQKYGSYFFIGYIICNYEFGFDKPIEGTCIKCGECIRRCPGNAILGDFNINPNKCISYITQKKDELTAEQIEILKRGKTIFGCDICQEVCPHNRGISKTPIREFSENLIYRLEYEKLIAMSNKEFKKVYWNRAFGWRGRNTIIRNFDELYGHRDN